MDTEGSSAVIVPVDASVIAIPLNPHPLKKQTQRVRHPKLPNRIKAGPPAHPQ
jgi:hypothetical protein